MNIDIDPFALFAAYHLGLDLRAPAKARHRNAHDVARMFGIDVESLERALADNAMSADRMMNVEFDLVGARLDLEVSPPGVDLVSLAQMHWDLYRQAKERPRDWDRELAEDARINEETFKKR